MDSDGPSSVSPPGKKKKLWYRQGFCEDWLTVDELKDWLKPDPSDKFAALCSVCDCKLKNCNRVSLLNHKDSSKHLKNYSDKKKCVKIQSFLRKPRKDDFHDKVSKAEVLLTGYIAEHGVPFAQADHLVETIKKMFPDCEVARDMTLKKTKTSYVLQEGIAWEERENIATICRERNFSLIIDESTDVSVSQVLAVMVRYYDEKKCRVTDALLDIVEVDDASASGLYKCVKELLESKNIPLKNIIGFASDNCSTMLGKNNGFQALLKKDVPHVFIIGCVCHSFALCASRACACLPSWLESLMKDICCYFARSSKRQHDFQLLQEVVQAPKHKMLKLSQTRWLSRGKVISRILEQWEALKLFFQSEAKTDKIDGARQIFSTMNAPGTKHMLVFLNYVLQKVDRMNLEFQSENFRLSTLYSSITDEYRSLLGMFVRDEVVQQQNLGDIIPHNTTSHKTLEELELGGRCEAMLTSEPLKETEERFRNDCKVFLAELCGQIRKRFTFEEQSVLALLRALEPSEALSPQRNMKSISQLAVHFPMLVKEEDLDKLQDQWRDLLYTRSSLEKISKQATTFWSELKNVKDGNNICKFGLLSQFMCSLLALPHSSASVERIFSQLNLIKTNKTNRLHVATAANRILAKQAISRQDVPCYNWEPSRSLIDDLKNGKCHQRYENRLKETRKMELATFSGDAAADDDDDNLSRDIFLQ